MQSGGCGREGGGGGGIKKKKLFAAAGIFDRGLNRNVNTAGYFPVPKVSWFLRVLPRVVYPTARLRGSNLEPPGGETLAAEPPFLDSFSCGVQALLE